MLDRKVILHKNKIEKKTFYNIRHYHFTENQAKIFNNTDIQDNHRKQ